MSDGALLHHEDIRLLSVRQLEVLPLDKLESGCIPRYELELCQHTLEVLPHSIVANLHNKAGYDTHQQSGFYLLNRFPMRLQLSSSYSYFNPTVAICGNVFMYLLGKTCHLCHPTFNKDMVGPHTSAALVLVNLTAYTSEQTFVQIVPLSGAGLLVHLPRLPSGWTLLMLQALHVQDTALHPAHFAPGGKQCPWAEGLPTDQSI